MPLTMSSTNIDLLKQIGINAVQQAGVALLHLFGRNRMLAEKLDGDWVTQADLESARIIRNIMHNSHPKIGLIFEEDISQDFDVRDPVWIIDPLDGTHNFSLEIPVFTISATLVIDGSPFLSIVNQPFTKQIIVAHKGQGVTLGSERLSICSENLEDHLGTVCYVIGYANRRETLANNLLLELREHSTRVLELWAPSLSWCLVAREKADSVICLYPSRFDNIGGSLILEEAGGVVTSIKDKNVGQNQRFHPLPFILVGSTHRTIHQEILKIIRRCVE